MIELLAIPLVIVIVAGVVHLALKTRAQRQALFEHLTNEGWRWQEKLADVDSAGDSPGLPTWLRPSSVAHFRLGPKHQVVYSDVLEGEFEGARYAGFTRVKTYRGHRNSDAVPRSFLMRERSGQREPIPDVLFVRAHALTNALAGIDDVVAGLEGDVMRLIPALPDFQGWRLHATPAGQRWLQSPAGQQLAAMLDPEDWHPQHAFGVSGGLLICEYSLNSIEDHVRAMDTLNRLDTLLRSGS